MVEVYVTPSKIMRFRLGKSAQSGNMALVYSKANPRAAINILLILILAAVLRLFSEQEQIKNTKIFLYFGYRSIKLLSWCVETCPYKIALHWEPWLYWMYMLAIRYLS